MRIFLIFFRLSLTTLAVGFIFLTLSAQAEDLPRDPWLQPFASDSIWNLPVASGAIYTSAHFQPAQVLPEIEYLVRTYDSTPMRPVYFPGSPYRANGTRLSWLNETRVPNDFLVADISLRPYRTPNACTAFVNFPSGNIVQLQPTTRLTPAGPIYGFPQTGENIRGQGERGTHYGSGLSTLGGSIRAGELTGNVPIRHTLKLLVQGSKYLYRGVPEGPAPKGFGYHWPATCCDNYAQQQPKRNGYGGTDPLLSMGSLVALDMDPTTLGLVDPRALKLAQALRDYGAYIVDDTAWNNYALAVSNEAAPDLQTIPQSDLQKIIMALSVISNTSPEFKKGPGVPRQPLLPPISLPTK